MKTRELNKDGKMEIKEKRSTDERRWTRMQGAIGEPPPSRDKGEPRKLFGIRASQGSSVFKLLFPG